MQPRKNGLRNLLNNLTVGCSVVLKFGTEFDYVTASALQIFKVDGLKVKVRARRQSGTDKLVKFRLGENSNAERRARQACSRSLGQLNRN